MTVVTALIIGQVNVFATLDSFNVSLRWKDTIEKQIVNPIHHSHIAPVSDTIDPNSFQNIDFVAFDTETTGLWAPSHRLVEIAGIKFQLTGNRTETFQSLVNPKMEMPREVIEVHGITDEMVADSDTAEVVLNKFLDFCGSDSILVAHNALFDISFLACELDRIGIERPENYVLDTVTILQNVFPGLEGYSLLALAQHFKLAQEQRHRALDDAILVQQLFKLALAKLPAVDSIDKLTATFSPLKISDWQQEEVSLPNEYAGIAEALESNLRVEINYKSNDQPPRLRVIRPFAVYAIKSRIYINAYCELVGEERTFRLDRIESFRLLE